LSGGAIYDDRQSLALRSLVVVEVYLGNMAL